MYKLNGVLLDNDSKGWYMQMGSEPWSGPSRDAVTLRIPGTDGVVTGLSLDRDAAMIPLKVRMPKTRLREFLALVDSATTLTTEDNLYSAYVEPISATPTNLPTLDYVVDVDCLFRVPSGVWRDAADASSTPVALSSGNLVIDVFTGLAAPVRDVTVRVKGPWSSLRVEDVKTGAWFSYNAAMPSGQSLMFTDGFAVTTNFADTNWDDYTANVTNLIDFGGPRGRFEIHPTFSDPETRKGSLRILTTAPGAGAQAWVRGKGAYFV